MKRFFSIPPFWFLAGVLVAVVFPLRFAVAAFRPWGGGILDDFCGRDSILARSFEQRIRTEGLRYFQSRGAQGASASEGTSSNFEGLTIFDEGRVCYIRDSAGEIMRDGLSSSDLDRIVSAFLATHDDEYDFIMLFTSFQWNQAFAFYSPIANDAAGIGYAHWAGRDRFDFSPGSPLQGFIFMNADFIYDGAETPNDQIITEIVFGQELGHRWGAYVHFDADPDPDTVEERDDLLGRQKAHWSYYVDTHWSWMEGNDWVDNGDGTFSADFETFPEEAGYFPLDLYLMGLIPAGEVPPFFLVTDSDAPRSPSDPPEYFRTSGEWTIDGTRRDVTIEDILAIEGPRDPDWRDSQKSFRIGTILFLQDVSNLSEARKEKMEHLLSYMETFWKEDVRGLATLDFTLGRSYTTPPVAVAGPPQEVREHTPVTFDGSRSFDPDSAKGDRIVSFLWDFGDTTRAEGPLVTHVYDAPGVYTVTLTVTDQTNNQATGETEVTVVANAAPLADIAEGRPRGSVGEPVSLDASASHDPDGDPLRYLWEVTGRPPGSAALLSAATIPRIALLPDLPGIYTVRLRVADIFGQEAEPVEVSIEVAAARTETATPNATEGGGGCAFLPASHRRGGCSLPLSLLLPLFVWQRSRKGEGRNRKEQR